MYARLTTDLEESSSDNDDEFGNVITIIMLLIYAKEKNSADLQSSHCRSDLFPSKHAPSTGYTLCLSPPNHPFLMMDSWIPLLVLLLVSDTDKSV